MISCSPIYTLFRVILQSSSSGFLFRGHNVKVKRLIALAARNYNKMTSSSSPGYGRSNHQSQSKVVRMFAQEGNLSVMLPLCRVLYVVVPPWHNLFSFLSPSKVEGGITIRSCYHTCITASCLNCLCQRRTANALSQSNVNAGVRCILKVNGIQSHETKQKAGIITVTCASTDCLLKPSQVL